MASKFRANPSPSFSMPQLVYQNRKASSSAGQLFRIILTGEFYAHFKLCILHTASITPTYTVTFLPVCRIGLRVVSFSRKITEWANYTRRARLGGHATRGERRKLASLLSSSLARSLYFAHSAILHLKLETTRKVVCLVDPGGAISTKIFMIFNFLFMYVFNQPVTKRVEEWVHKAIAKHVGIVWLDRTAIFKVKSSFLSSQTIPACFAIPLWSHSSTRFVTG